ncbi:MAG: cysteine--tRNA ligase [bacterium]|nr:cysteine--tRNA ligase [bacterium]
MKIYNTLKRDYEDFVPITNSKVGIYMCGMTVQDRPHLGHMRTFLFGDVLRRYLEYKGYEVIYIQNFTDIDDKIIQRSKAENIDWRVLGDKYEQEFLKSAEILNLKPATYYPKATQFIQEIIELITILINKGIAYESNGNVYFEVGKFKSYGKLSGKNIDDLKESFRIEPDLNKKNPLDFALWKAYKEGEPYWHSPWGKGRPGWHIECSVMSTHFLGQPFDIHMGGQDLIFPHHEDEIAQSEAAYEREFVKYWIHSAPMLIKGEKMSKSTGLYFAISDLLERFSPEAIRLFILQKHYRSPAEYVPEYIEEAEKAINRLKSFLHQVSAESGKIIEEKIREFEKAIEDDLNTPKAISIIFELLKEGNIKLQQGESAVDEAATILFISEVLGFRTANFTERKVDTEKISELVRIILDVRQELRKTKNFELADRIRSELERLGIKIKDTRDGTIFEF